jgi:hypothetical protein
MMMESVVSSGAGRGRYGMKIEDAKALLIDCTDLICRECNDRHRGCEKQKSYPDFASTVLVALEKQIPKEPKIYKNSDKERIR